MTTPLTLEMIPQAPKALLDDPLDGGLRLAQDPHRRAGGIRGTAK